MFKDLAWNHFMMTGNIDSYLEYKKIEEINDNINEKKGELVDETYKGKRNCNQRSSI